MLGNLISSRGLWAEIKSAFACSVDDPNFELAKTFYNSITRRIFATVGVDPEIEFATLDLVIRDWEPEPRILRRYSATGPGETTFSKILDDYRFAVEPAWIELFHVYVMELATLGFMLFVWKYWINSVSLGEREAVAD